MSIEVDEKGTISLYQGDSGEIIVTGLDSTKSLVVYFAIQNKNRKLIGDELKVVASNKDSISFFLTPDYTDLLEVPMNKPFEIYYYGIKVCENETKSEDTLFVENSTYGDLNQIIVYPKKVVGL